MRKNLGVSSVNCRAASAKKEPRYASWNFLDQTKASSFRSNRRSLCVVRIFLNGFQQTGIALELNSFDLLSFLEDGRTVEFISTCLPIRIFILDLWGKVVKFQIFFMLLMRIIPLERMLSESKCTRLSNKTRVQNFFEKGGCEYACCITE